MELEQALACVKAAGFRVSKPREKEKKLNPLKLNAVGKPYSPQYDPNYRMKYHPRKYAPSTPFCGPTISPERWVVMCAEANEAWDKFMQE